MNDTIIFIHGMFQNAKSWSAWTKYFSDRGYECLAKSWPLHEGEPSALRAHPPAGLGDLRLQAVIDEYAALCQAQPRPPIVIGHSVGGLIVQKLAELGLVKAGVAISSVAPNRMLAFDWGFFRNSLQITNPLVGDAIFEMTPEGFHKNFANTLDANASNLAYEQTATHDSRNMLRDCMLDTGHIDLHRPHAPLLFIAGEADEIIPPQLCEKNSQAYDDLSSIANYTSFPNRSHFICGEPGWEEVTLDVANWLSVNGTPHTSAPPAVATQTAT